MAKAKEDSLKIGPFIIQAIVIIVVIVACYFVCTRFLGDKVEARRMGRMDTGVLVEVEAVEQKEHTVQIHGTGQVEASHTQTLKSEANGRVIWISPDFYPGAHIAKGTVIAKINTDDYATKVSNAKIQLRQKEVNLMLEEAKGRAAETELKTLRATMSDTSLSEKEAALVRRQPQLQNALADVELAKNNLKQAQRDYDRSIIKCPYDAIVTASNISLGDYISGGTNLGTIVATDEFWVYLSIPPGNMTWLDLDGDLQNLRAEVRYDMAGKTITKPARIKGMQPQVESLGRMVQLLLAVDNPLAPPTNEALLIGTFVNATIYASAPLKAIELPRAYVREGNLAYVCTEDNKLSIRSLTTPYRTDDYVYVTDGLEAGERVVTTLISSPVEGRKLRVKGEASENDVPQMGPGGFGGPGGPGAGRGPGGPGGPGGKPDAGAPKSGGCGFGGYGGGSDDAKKKGGPGGASGERPRRGGPDGASGERPTRGGADGASGERPARGDADGASGERPARGGADGASGEPAQRVPDGASGEGGSGSGDAQNSARGESGGTGQ